MDNKVNYAIVGGFVLSLFACIVLAVIWLSSGFSVATYKVYQVNMQEAVSGLAVDGVVEFNGVTVGTVKSVTIDQTNPNLVRVLLNIRNGTPISEGTVAKLGIRGLTGVTYIILRDTGSNRAPLVAQNDQPYPIIKTVPSFFLQMDTALSKLSESARQISQAVQSLLDQQNLQSIKQILGNLNSLTTTLASNNERLTAILDNTSAASRQLPTMVQTFQAETLPATNRLVQNLNRLSENLLQVSTELKSNPAVLIRGKEQQPLGPGE